MGASKRGDTVLEGEDTGEWSPIPRYGDTEEEPAEQLAAVSAEFLDDKPTRFDFRPPEFEDARSVLSEPPEPAKADDDDEIEVPMMSVEEALRASDPALGFSDGTLEHDMHALSPTGEGEDEFDSATVPTEQEESEIARALEAQAEASSHGLTPDGVDPRSIDPRGPTVRRSVSPAPAPVPSVLRPSLAPEARPSLRAPAVERQAGPKNLQVLNRQSIPPAVTLAPVSTPPPATTERPSKAPGPPRPSLLPPMMQTDDIRIIQHVEAAKRTAKIMPIAVAGGLSIAFAWVAFGGGDLANMSEEMKQEAAQVYASRAALRSEDREHAADPLIRIESDPPGARVEVNNVEIGRTPLLAPSPYSNAEYILVVMRDGQDTWQAYLKRDLRVSRRIEVLNQRYDAASGEVPRDKNGIAVVRVVLRDSK